MIGLDVGSTSTKIVVRTPFLPMSQGQAVPVPSWLRAEGHPYYWTTVLWEGEDGRYELLPPTQGARTVDRLKVAFLGAGSSIEDHADPTTRDLTA
ncbi:hypothetical protein [Rubellimicrobium rubrum]|uniref:hypothetical protein n=1 Tax=Rubellimicrobium rubrum TaxID=2585369 RepID=UPI001111ED6B|nr:hypothetical protein [Rubellimicrobium rubrum]